jgi:hypothetical protein
MPLALQVSSASLGAVTMYRTTAQELFGGLSEFMKSLRLFFQGVFLLASFHVALSLEPMLSPDPEDRVEYTRNDGNIGMKIDIRYVLRRELGIWCANMWLQQPDLCLSRKGHTYLARRQFSR